MVTEKMRLLPCYREQFEKNRPPIDMYQEEIDTRISNTLAVLEPSLIIGLSLIVGIILLSVMLPLMGIMSGI